MDQSKSDASRSSEETTLSADAAFYFSSRQYEKCNSATKQLLELKPNDSKMMMNKALLEFVHKRSFTQSDEYVAELKRIASIENVPLTFPVSSNVAKTGSSTNSTDSRDLSTTGSSSTPTPFQCKTTLPQSMLGIALQYNYALVLFYQRQYCQSERILANCLGINRESDFLSPESPSTLAASGIELAPSTDMTLCRRVLLLWLEVLLRLQHPEEVYNLCSTWLTYLSSITIANTLNASGNANSTVLSTAVGSRHCNTQTSHMLNGIRLPIQLFYIRACLLTDRLTEAEEELQIVRSERTQTESYPTAKINPSDESAANSTSLDSAGGEKGVPDTSDVTNEPAGVSADSNPTSKSNVPNSETGLTETSDASWDVGRCIEFIEAHLAYLKSDFSTALRCLSDIPPSTRAPLETGQCESTLVWNNLALVHHRAGQFNLSGLQLRRALRETDKAIRDIVPQSRSNSKATSKNAGYLPSNEQYIIDQIPLHAFSLSPHHVLLHNFGLQLLFARKPTVAFVTLLQLVRIYPRNPRLWFRLAECCIKVHRPNNLQAWQLETRKCLTIEPVGIGPCRHLMLGVKQNEVTKPWVDAPSLSAPTLEFASLCLRNALLLLPRPPSNLTSNEHSAAERREALLRWSESQRVPALPAPSVIRGIGLLHLLSAVYLATAYVALCLKNPVDALASASHLLSPELSRNIPDGTQGGGKSQPTDEIRTAMGSSGAIGLGQSDTAPVHSGSATSNSPTGCGSDPLCLVAPPAYRYLARLYFAEALIMMDRLPESLAILSCGATRPLAGGNCVSELSSALHSVCLAEPFLMPDLQSEQSNEESTKANDKDKCASGSHPRDRTRASIYPTDFPATPDQATSLHLFNLACALAISREWTVAEHYLLPSLTGLALSAPELDGRKWPTTPEAVVNTAHHPASGTALMSTPVVLPVQALILRLYLFLVLGKRHEALTLLRDSFGHECLTGRLNSTTVLNSVLPSPTELNGNNTVMSTDLRQLLKPHLALRSGLNSTPANPINSPVTNLVGVGSANSSGAQRPTSLWLPLTAHGNRPIQSSVTAYPGQHMSTSLQPQFSNVPSLHTNGWWEHRPTPTQPHTTGLITPANESDWPPL